MASRPCPALGFRYDRPASSWPVVTWVDPEGPAGLAGLRQGDLIVSVDGVPTLQGGTTAQCVTPGLTDGGGDVLGLLHKGPSDTLRLAVCPSSLAHSTAARPSRVLLVALGSPARPDARGPPAPAVAEDLCGTQGETEGAAGEEDSVVSFSMDSELVRVAPRLAA